MSRVNELLDELFGEMVKEGDDVARNEYSVAGIDFIFEAEIMPLMDNDDEEVDGAYGELKRRYWITRDDERSLYIHTTLPYQVAEGWDCDDEIHLINNVLQEYAHVVTEHPLCVKLTEAEFNTLTHSS